jgi:TatD DNase family protein
MLIDSHCHLPHKLYEKDVETILKEAKEWGVEKLINIGTSVKENEKVIEVSRNYEDIPCSVGIHPQEDRNLDLGYLAESLEEVLEKSGRIVAIGECGIDISKWEKQRPVEDQEKLFDIQVKLAKRVNLPLIIHNRNGNDTVLKVLNNNLGSGLRGVIHCFDSNWEFAKKVLDLGFYVSFTNLISYPKKDALLEVVKNVPDDRFLVETDAPYLPPQSMRGEINYPKYVKIVAEKVAQVKEKTFEDVCEFSYSNTCSLFNLC